MTTDSDRILRLNLAAVALGKLNTEPGGYSTLVKRMREHLSGPASGSLEPGRGSERSDPTGKAGTSGWVGDAERDLREFNDALDRLHAAVLDVARVIDDWTPPERAKVSDGDGFSDLFCRSCWRVDQTCTPVARRADGRPYYTGMCLWCGRLCAELGLKKDVLPPLELVKRHLQGGDKVVARNPDGSTRTDQFGNPVLAATAGHHMTKALLQLYRRPSTKGKRKKSKKAA